MVDPVPSLADVIETIKLQLRVALEGNLIPGDKFHFPSLIHTEGDSWLVTIQAERVPLAAKTFLG